MEVDARGMFEGLTSARARPAGEVAGVDPVRLARDVFLSEQEFRRAGEYLSGERASSEGRTQSLGDFLKGAGWGTLAVASVTPWGGLGKLGKAARAGQDVFEVTRAEGAVDLGRLGQFVRAGEPAGEATPVLRGSSLTEYPDTFEPVDLPFLDKVYSKKTTQLYRWQGPDGTPGPVEETVTGPRSAGKILDSDFLNGRERYFHGTPSAENVDRIIAEGLFPSEYGTYGGGGVYGTTSLSDALSYGVKRASLSSPRYSRELSKEASRAAREDLRYVFEFVADTGDVDDLTRVTTSRPEGVGYARILGGVPAERIAALHVFQPIGFGKFRLVDSRVFDRELGSALEDYGVLPRGDWMWEIPEGVDGLTRSVLESARAAGMSLDEALERVNRTRANEGLPPVGGVAKIETGESGASAGMSGNVQPSLLRAEGGLFEASLPGVRVQELAQKMIQRQLDNPRGLAAVPPEEIGEALRQVPEVREFLRAYREFSLGGNRKFDVLAVQPSANEFARRAGLSTPRRLGASPEVSLDLALTRATPEQVRVAAQKFGPAAVNLGTRLRNSSVFVTDDIYSPAFYVDFNSMLREVEQSTGFPTLTFSVGLAAASAKAAPYDEIQRIVRIAPSMEFRNGQAYFPTVKEIEALGPGNHPLYPKFRADGTPGTVDTFAVTAGRGWAEAINNPNFLDEPIFGIAAKTMPYAYLRFDPAYGSAYVADTVDGLGQFLIKGEFGKTDTSGAMSAIQNQFAGRMLAEIYGVPASAVQEAIWAYIRIARDGFLSPTKSGWSADAIAPAFRGSQGTAEKLLKDAIDALDPRIVQLAKRNYRKFEDGVRSGSADTSAWSWDEARNMPTITSEQFLIQPGARSVAKGRAPRVQEAMLRAVQAAGPALRERLLALAALSGVSMAAMVDALGKSGADLPPEAFDA